MNETPTVRPAAQSPPRVSVIVPHFSDLEGLACCLKALDRQTFGRQDFEVIVADNDSPQGADAVSAVIAGRARLEVVRERGAGPARNGGVAVSTGEVLAFTDSDCLPEPGWLAAGVAALDRYDVVGGAMTVLVDDPKRMTPEEAFERAFAFDNKDYVTRKGFTVSANLFCPAAVFRRVGGFKVGVPEDLEWCHRARAAGYTLGYAPGALVGHPARRTWPDLIRKWRRLNAESFALYEARPGGRLIWLARALAMPLSAVAQTPRLLRAPALPGAGAKLAALGVLYRVRLWRLWDSLRLLSAGAGVRS